MANTSQVTDTKPKNGQSTQGSQGSQGNQKPAPAAGSKAPEGYRKAESNVALDGYWVPEKGPIHGKLIGIFDFRQKSGKGKGQLRRVYVIDLLDPCICQVVTEGLKGGKAVEETELPSRSIVGIFGSAGLKELDELGQCFVFVRPQIDPKTGKQAMKELESGNEMKLYDVDYKGTPKPIKIRQAKLGSDESDQHEEGSRAAMGASSDDELPF